MPHNADSEPQPNNVKNRTISVVLQIVFPVVTAWMGFQAIVEQAVSIRLKSSSNSSGRREWMLGQDAVEFGIGLILFAVAAHVLVYKNVLPERYHTILSRISRAAVCGAFSCWCLSVL